MLVTPSIKFNSAAVAVTRVLFKNKPVSVPVCPETFKFFPVPPIITSPVKVAPAKAAFAAIELVTVVEKLASSFNAAANSFNVSNVPGASLTNVSTLPFNVRNSSHLTAPEPTVCHAFGSYADGFGGGFTNP